MRSRIRFQGALGKVTLAATSALVFSLLLDRLLLLLGFPSHPPVSYCNPAGLDELRRNIEFNYRFTTNSQGVRYDDIPLAKPAGSWRVLVVGDSFVEGVGVDVAARFTERLQGSFRGNGRQVSFINGGLAGTGPLDYGRVFLKVGLKYNVDGLLIVLYANDIADTPPAATPLDMTSETPVDMYPDADYTLWHRAIQHLWPRAFTQLRLLRTSREYREKTRPRDFVQAVSAAAARAGVTQEQIERWKMSLPADLVTAFHKGMFNGSILSKGLLYPTHWTDSLDVDTPLAERKWRAMASILSAIVTAARSRGLEVGVVFVPVSFQYDPASHGESNPWIRTGTVIRDAWLSGHTEVERRLEAWAKELAVPFLDLTDSLREAAKTRRDLTWPLDGHWTPEGHLVASRAMYQWMVTEHVFSFLH